MIMEYRANQDENAKKRGGNFTFLKVWKHFSVLDPGTSRIQQE